MSTAFYDRIKNRLAQHVAKRPQPRNAPKTRQNVTHNRFDRKMWDEIRKQDQVDSDITDLLVGDLRGGDREGYDNAPELLQDVSYLLYKPSPDLVDRRQVEKDARLNRKILEAIEKSQHYEALREHTVLDEVLTGIAMTTVAETVREIITRHQEEVAESNRKKAEKEDQLNNEKNRPQGCFPVPGQGSEPGDGPGEPGDEPGEPGNAPGGSGGAPAPANESEGDENEGNEGDPSEGAEGTDEAGDDPAAGPELGEGDDEFDDAPETPDADDDDDDGPEIDIERYIDQAMQDAADEAEELNSLRRGIGLEDGEWRSMSPEARLAMAERLSTPEMKAAAEMFGSMKRMALGAQATKVIDVPHEAYDVTTGDDIRDALGSEFALLDDVDTELEFYRRYLEKEMLVYKKRGKEEAGKGPIIVCIDKSYSMNGQPFTWAMGVAEALRRICQDQERDYYAMFFGSNNDRHRFEFSNGKGPFEKVLEFLSVAATGGTEFDGVLEEAIARVSESFGAGRERADIVFITDGQAHLTESWVTGFNAKKEEIGCRVFGIYIGGAHDMGGGFSGPTAVLDSFSDAVIPVRDLTTSSVREVFAQV